LKISTTKKKSIAYTLNKPKNQQINNWTTQYKATSEK
jgi:hypothetical protein